MAHSPTSTVGFLMFIVAFIVGGATSNSLARHKFRARGNTVGGYSSVDIDEALVKEMANFATIAMSESSNSGPLALIKILKAESQVVAGKNFKLILELDNIRHDSEDENLVCEVVVFHQSWTNTRQLSKSSCLPTRVIHSWTKSRELSESNGPLEIAPAVEAVEIQAPIAGGYSPIDQSWTNTRQLSESSCLPSTDLVTEIIRAIDGHEELRRVAGYLNASRDELSKEFPLVSPDGTKLSYTFFAPTSFAFAMQTPQDVGDPLLMDSDFRRSILIRHLTNSIISSDDLTKLDLVVMASKTANLTRKSTNEVCNLPPVDNENRFECEAHFASWTFKSNSGTCESYVYDGCGQTANLFETEAACQAACDPSIHTLTHLINEAEIQLTAIPLAQDFGTVYVINRVFMDGDEVNEILSKHSSPGYAAFLGHPMMEAIPMNANETILGRITGGFASTDVDDVYIKEIADFAIAAMSANSGSVRLVRIIKADSQIVAGKKIKLILELNRVVEGDDGDGLLCDAVIFDQPWTNTRNLSESSCLPTRTIASWNEVHKQPPREQQSNCLQNKDSVNNEDVIADVSL